MGTILISNSATYRLPNPLLNTSVCFALFTVYICHFVVTVGNFGLCMRRYLTRSSFRVFFAPRTFFTARFCMTPAQSIKLLHRLFHSHAQIVGTVRSDNG